MFKGRGIVKKMAPRKRKKICPSNTPRILTEKERKTVASWRLRSFSIHGRERKNGRPERLIHKKIGRGGEIATKKGDCSTHKSEKEGGRGVAGKQVTL